MSAKSVVSVGMMSETTMKRMDFIKSIHLCRGPCMDHSGLEWQITITSGLYSMPNLSGFSGHLECVDANDHEPLPCNPAEVVVAIAELRKRTAELVAKKYGVPAVYADHRQMLEKEELDGVVASQPFTRHAVLVPELYASVDYLFTEKPLAVSPQAGEKLVEAAARAGCTHMVGYNKRSDPATIHAKSVIDRWKASGEMGATARFFWIAFRIPRATRSGP